VPSDPCQDPEQSGGNFCLQYHVSLARALLEFLAAKTFEPAPSRPNVEERMKRWLDLMLDRYLRRPVLKSLLIVSLLLMGLGALVDLSFLLVNRPSLAAWSRVAFPSPLRR
jgi:hypothetical protein